MKRLAWLSAISCLLIAYAMLIRDFGTGRLQWIDAPSYKGWIFSHHDIHVMLGKQNSYYWLSLHDGYVVTPYAIAYNSDSHCVFFQKGR